MVLPASAPLATITALVAVGGNGTHTICVQGNQGPQGSGQTSCCQIALPTPRQFMRGDSNDDKTVNLADAIASLQMLFGSLPMTCHDAVDANDDGATDLSDPIYVLTYLLGVGWHHRPLSRCGGLNRHPKPSSVTSRPRAHKNLCIREPVFGLNWRCFSRFMVLLFCVIGCVCISAYSERYCRTAIGRHRQEQKEAP